MTGRRGSPGAAASPGWASLRVGAGLLAALVLACASIFFLDALQRASGAGSRLRVVAAEARGLEVGSDVWVAGVPAGRVVALRFRPPGTGSGRVLVEAELEAGAARELRADASATVRASALLAPAVLSVSPGRLADRPYDFGDTLRARTEVAPDAVLARADSLRARLAALRPRGRELARRLDEGPGTLAALRRHPGVLDRLERDAGLTARLARDARGGTVPRLLADTALQRRAARVSARLRTMTREAPGPGADGRAASLAAALDSLERTARSLRRGLARGRGTAGRLLHDRALQRERALLEARADSLTTYLLANPFRWLRFTLF